MCDAELDEEFERRDKAAAELAEHLYVMGADNAIVPITTIHGCYLIQIKKTI